MPDASLVTLEAVRAAAERLRGKVHRTPLFSSEQIGDRCGARLFLKAENLQKTGSFKARGALNRVLSLTAEEKARGLVTFSAGNHAAAVAWAGRSAGAPATVVMPSAAPAAKVDAVKGYGAEVSLEPDRAQLFARMNAIREERGLTLVPPFDDPDVIAGAATAALEVLEDLPEADVFVAAVGGAGLLSGMVTVVRALRPAAKVIAVEIEGFPGLRAALSAGKPVTVAKPAQTWMDGLTAPFVGEINFAIVKDQIDDLVTVTEAEAFAAMELLMSRAKLFVEGAGAAATAALLAGKVPAARGRTTVAMISGGNVDLERIAAAVRAP